MDTATGEAVYAEASLKGKKKDAVLQCALNACRMLDAQDILRHSVPGGVHAVCNSGFQVGCMLYMYVTQDSQVECI